MRKILFFVAIVLPVLLNVLHAQDTPSTVLKFERASGVVLSQDSLFGMTFRFRMQNRAWFFSESGSDLSPAEADMRIRRLRLRFDGHVISPRLLYRIQLGFSRADLDLIEGEIAHPIRDAMVFYKPSAHWLFGFGQTKIPGNRQRVVSSSALQLPDRSRVNALFTLDRDFGAFMEWQGSSGQQHLMLKGSITTGEGRNAAAGDAGLCYTGRVEWLPLGLFANDGDYFEGDLEREQSPKLSFGAVISTNVGAIRAGGQLGPEFNAGQQRTLNVFIADALLKYKGLAISTEYIQRRVEGDPMTGDVPDDTVAAYEGWGWNSQASHLLGSRWEVVSRYSIVQPGPRIAHLEDRVEEIWLGSTYYLNHHRIKFQVSAAYFWRDGMALMDLQNDKWGLMLQAEFGI